MYGGRRGVIITTASAVTCQPWSAVFQAMPSSRRRTDLPAVHCPPHRSHRLPLPGPPAASISSVSQGAPVEMPKDSPASAITITIQNSLISHRMSLQWNSLLSAP